MSFWTIFTIGIVVIWSIAFIVFTLRDLKCENKKSALIAAGKEVDPFIFSGDKARAEAKAAYDAGDVVLKKYFEEQDIVKWLEK